MTAEKRRISQVFPTPVGVIPYQKAGVRSSIVQISFLINLNDNRLS